MLKKVVVQLGTERLEQLTSTLSELVYLDCISS
jgi:hypothetical protein